MSDKATILVQLDTDPHPSAFDRVVAVDAGVVHLFSYGGVSPAAVMPLVHGCIFTRGPKDLHRTAVFVGGSDAAAAEAVFAEVKRHLIPQYGLNVSVMLDPNGANTTAAAAVRAADRGGVICYGALGVGGTKMKIHKSAIVRLFEVNNAVLDIEEVYDIALNLP